MILVNTLSLISQARFASEHWNALKTDSQRALSPLENTFLQREQMERQPRQCSCHRILWKDSRATFQRSGKLHPIRTLYTTHAVNPGSTLPHAYLLWSLPIFWDRQWFPNKNFWGGRAEINAEESVLCQAIFQPWDNLEDRNSCPHLPDEETEFQRDYDPCIGLWASKMVEPRLEPRTAPRHILLLFLEWNTLGKP